MFDLLLRHARLVDDTLTNIALQDGKIAVLGDVDGPAVKTIDLRGECYVSAGWIDSHVHCYPTSPITMTNRTAWVLPLALPQWWMQAALAQMILTIFTP